ncbi:hypothetical protein BN844_4763 [Pseudomonas sp. SHC52]|nr:hypothetical protein BN844_4763 [Pseudomonas sp. SHC52]
MNIGDSYAYVFTCMYKHMQSSGQLVGGPFRNLFGNSWKARN